jgi:PAS domain S-box-containing protein
MMRLTLRHKINSAILITFVVISLIFISIQLMLQNNRSESVSKEIEALLQMVVEREGEDIANEIYQDLTRALTLRLDLIRGKGNIFLISAFDDTGKLIVSRGDQPETSALSRTEMDRLGDDPRIDRKEWQGVFSMVYLQRIEIIGEPIGYLRICYSLENMRQEQRKAIAILGALLLSILAVMLVLLNFIMSRIIVKPILSLSENMNRMQAGKIERHVYRKSRDEIGTLSAAFNKMATDLATSYREVDLKRNQLQEAQRYLSNIINFMPSILLGVDTELKVSQWNLQAERASGVAAKAAIGKTVMSVLPELSPHSKMIEQALRNHRTVTAENAPWKKGGETTFMDITVYPLISSGMEGAVIRIDDVTNRRRIEAALRNSEEKYRMVVDNANDGVVLVQDDTIKFANPQAYAIHGYSEEEVASRPVAFFIVDEDRPQLQEHYRKRLAGEPSPDNYNVRITTKAGKQRWLNINAVPVTWEQRPAILLFLRDVSEAKKAEEQLLHAQKMEAIGILAGGIAHDFNNLLQVIQGYTQLVLFNKKDDAYRRELEAILAAARKGGELTMQLLTFGRKVESHPQSVEINTQIEKAEGMLSRTIPKMIRIELQLKKDLPTVYVDPGQIEQVVMNLVINARDAMPEGGRIVIETDAVTLDEESAKAELVPGPGQYVRLKISDSGQGMSSEIMGHIFEPFFTTKKLGDGTGLGLAIVYGIVQNHNGSIQCHSVPGEGTSFTVYFPAGDTMEEDSPGEKSADSPAPLVGGDETILLVDDEETLQDIGRQILEYYGYNVLSASSAEEALEIYSAQSPPDGIHLVILDLVMPGMGGAKGIDAFLELDPEVKIIVASGYMINDGKDCTLSADPAKIKGFIKKPFDLEGILQEVRRVLDEKA